MKFITYIKDFISLIYPQLCLACGQGLVTSENSVCISCLYKLPYTSYHLQPDNKVMKQFWGRVEVLAATAFLYFKKGSLVQKLMHQLKYHNQQEVGIVLGKLYGKNLRDVEVYSNADVIVPVPLHKTRFKKRGYNQSEQFAIGLAEAMNIKVDTSILIRQYASETQVNKSRYNRYTNMADVFVAYYQNKYKKIILVDDTITTGATLEACTIALQKVGYKQINIVGIAFSE